MELWRSDHTVCSFCISRTCTPKVRRKANPGRRRRVLGDAWLRNLETIQQEEGPVQFVFFTGDAVHSGKPEEYAGVTEFFRVLCDELGIGLDRLFVVPGNHDLDRSVQESAWKSMRMRASVSNDLLGVSRWMNGIGTRPPAGFEDSWKNEILQRQAGYRAWVAGPLQRAELAPDGLGYRSTVQLAGWAHRLLLTENQVPGLRIVLMHHPLHEMTDGSSARRLIAEHADLVLRGHLHQTEVVELIDPDRRPRELASGSLYEGGLADTYGNSCQFVRLELDSNLRPIEAMVRFRSFSPRGGHAAQRRDAQSGDVGRRRRRRTARYRVGGTLFQRSPQDSPGARARGSRTSQPGARR